MPIYEYRCSTCGFQNEYLQKVTDPLLSRCPECGKETFQKLLSAAGFQLKGSGWYVTDFRNKGARPASGDEAKSASGAEAKPDAKADAKGGAASEPKSETQVKEKPEAKPKAASSA